MESEAIGAGEAVQGAGSGPIGRVARVVVFPATFVAGLVTAHQIMARGAPPETVRTSSPATTATPPTVGANASSGTRLAEILEPYEAQALADTMFTSYRFSCWPYSGPQGPASIDWERDELDRNQLVSRGAVLTCLPRTDSPADSGHMDLVVLDDLVRQLAAQREGRVSTGRETFWSGLVWRREPVNGASVQT